MEKVIRIVHLREGSYDLAFWLSKTPQERIAAMEMLRQQYAALKGIEPRLQRVCRIAESA